MLYVLDTHICDLLRQKHPSVISRVEVLNEKTETVATTIISFDESMAGCLFVAALPGGARQSLWQTSCRVHFLPADDLSAV